jgi:hypothetical protein
MDHQQRPDVEGFLNGAGMQLVIASFALAVGLTVGVSPAAAQIRVNPTGVNVNAQGATTVFLTFGGLRGQIAGEAFWCGELIAAAPDIGLKCDPATIFGTLPARFDLSRPSGVTGFTDIMSIPPSVARRAYQAAAAGQTSTFFYVRRFVSLSAGPSEYVAVTCRPTGGGARVPLALVDVRLSFEVDAPVLYLNPGETVPPLHAEITYNGTGRLIGRWEVVLPGEDQPTAEDLLPEASLPIERRSLQRRYSAVERFNAFLPPTGRFTLPGPRVDRLPTAVNGTYLVLLRVEASEDREGDSDLAAAGAGEGIVHSGAVAGFPLSMLRYVVGGASTELPAAARGHVALLAPADNVVLAAGWPLELRWASARHAALYRVEIQDRDGTPVFDALVQGVTVYRAPPWLKDRASGGALRWRVLGIDSRGRDIGVSAWRLATVE